jgi:hypothetical protein
MRSKINKMISSHKHKAIKISPLLSEIACDGGHVQGCRIFVQGNGRIYKECAFQAGPLTHSKRNPLRTEDVRDQSHNLAARIF